MSSSFPFMSKKSNEQKKKIKKTKIYLLDTMVQKFDDVNASRIWMTAYHKEGFLSDLLFVTLVCLLLAFLYYFFLSKNKKAFFLNFAYVHCIWSLNVDIWRTLELHDYIPFQVPSLRLESLSQAIDTVVAGILHDVVDDTCESLHSIDEVFGDDVARLVAGVSRLSYINQVWWTWNNRWFKLLIFWLEMEIKINFISG